MTFFCNINALPAFEQTLIAGDDCSKFVGRVEKIWTKFNMAENRSQIGVANMLDLSGHAESRTKGPGRNQIAPNSTLHSVSNTSSMCEVHWINKCCDSDPFL